MCLMLANKRVMHVSAFFIKKYKMFRYKHTRIEIMAFEIFWYAVEKWIFAAVIFATI